MTTGKPGTLLGMAAKRPAILFHCSVEERDEIQKAAAKMDLNVSELIREAVFAVVRGGMSLAPEIARHVRAEAKRLKVPAEHVLSSWVLSHVRKEGD